MVIPFRVSCKTGIFLHLALATAVVAFHRGYVSPYDVSTVRTGSGSNIVVSRCFVESIGCKFGVKLCTVAVGSIVF